MRRGDEARGKDRKKWRVKEGPVHSGKEEEEEEDEEEEGCSSKKVAANAMVVVVVVRMEEEEVGRGSQTVEGPRPR